MCERDSSFTAFIVGLQQEPDVGHTVLDRSVRIFLSCINTASLLAENQHGRNKELVATPLLEQLYMALVWHCEPFACGK